MNCLLPAIDHVTVESLRITPTELEVELRCVLAGASCPICQTPSHRVHSRYPRVVHDLPSGGRPVILRFWAHRFFCDNPDCRRRIFAEQLPELARRRGRGTPRLDQALARVGLECGGEPGRRLCGQLGITTSGDTILRRLRALPAVDRPGGNVIGVDDFAFRCGRRYGTIIVDHESGEPIELLEDRSSAALEAWLAARANPPAIITRDRSGSYAKAIATAAPGAIQVADRWHLLANCREALVRLLDRHHAAVAEGMKAVRAKLTDEGADQNSAQTAANPLPPADPPTPPPAAAAARNLQLSLERRARRLARYERVLELHRQGLSQRAITRQMKMSRTQVIKLLGAGTFPERAKTHRAKQVDGYLPQLRQCWDSGVRDARQLTQHVRSLGYTGGYDAVRRCVAFWRTPQEREKLRGAKSKPRSLLPTNLQRPSSDRLSWLLILDDLERREGESELLDELQRNCEPIRSAGEMARSFREAVRGRDTNALTAWTQRAMQTTTAREINGFAEGLVRNWPEVKAAVELPWSNGRTEGHVNRLKLIKRKMYGRANFDLLRIRVMARGP